MPADALVARLRAQIANTGPLSVADYMNACLHDPQAGYYATRPALGEHGDFITAPLVSQMFGELIGLWAVETWHAMGAPSSFSLAEVGPGDGTLMADMLRAARLDPGFLTAANLWLIETSAPLRAAQAVRLANAPLQPHWANGLDDLPTAPLILVANELLDCLAPRQFISTPQGWAERKVGLDAHGALAFGLSPSQISLPPAPEGSLYEDCVAQIGFSTALALRIVRDAGAALLIDYGRDTPGFGDTLQALRRHKKVDPLQSPGQADLTVHADFPGVLAAAREVGAHATVMTQGELLRRLGIEQRAQSLSQARPDQAKTIGRQLERLTAADQMGTLFKAACVYSPGFFPPAFEGP